MSAGEFLAGVGLAGHDPTETAGALTSATLTGAAKFDPFTRTYPMTDDGGVEEVSAVWQEVAHRLGIPLGAVASAPTVGIDVARLRSATRESAQRTVEDVVAVALKPMIARGDVRVDRVVLTLPWSGRWEAWVENLRESAPSTRAFASP